MITSPTWLLQPHHLVGRDVLRGFGEGRISPVSWIGKKPFGISMNSTTVSAMVAKNTPSVIALMPQHDVERAPIERRTARRSRAR